MSTTTTPPTITGSPAVAGPNGRAEPAGGAQAPGRRRLMPLLVGLAVAALLAAGIVGYRWWYDDTHFIRTDNAQIGGFLVQAGALSPGRVAAVRADIGDRVGQDQVVAALHVPVSVTTSTGVTRQEYRDTTDTLVEARAPIGGVVVARLANPGDTVPAGQPLLTIVDPDQLWVNANIEETQIRRVRAGQPVVVHVDALDADLEGRVVAIRPASAATFSVLPSQNVSGNFTKVTQLVPVKIALVTTDPRLMIGTSVEVQIRVAD